MLVQIYKPAYDCTLNGASSKHDSMTLKTPEQLTPEDDARPVLVVMPGYGDAKRVHALPIALYRKGIRAMFGGNFCYSSDSRFVSLAPIKIMDRVE